MLKRFFLFWVMFLGVTCVAYSDPTKWQLKSLKSGLGIVWGMDVLDSDRLVFTQRSGEAGILNLKNKNVTWFEALPIVYSVGQGGLLDVQKSPNFEQDNTLYFTYAKPTELSAVTVLAKAKLNQNKLQEWQDLFITQSHSHRNIHFGSRITFDHEGHVFFTVGDRGNRSQAQQLSNHAGKVLRLTLEGTVPKDNPFLNTPNALPEIWSYGHRNPQGLVFDPTTGRLWEMEHGPRGGDEINLVKKGQNYGWPIVSSGREYFSNRPIGVSQKVGMAAPQKVYVPSIAPSGLALWQGGLVAGALVLRHVNFVVLEGAETGQEFRFFEALNQRVRSVTADEFGRLFFATDQGVIYQVVH